MIFALFFFSISLMCYDHSYLQKKYEQTILTAIDFKNNEKDNRILDKIIFCSAELHPHIIGDFNPNEKHTYIFWYKDLQLKFFLMGRLKQLYNKEKKPKSFIQGYKLDEFLGSTGKILLETKITISYTHICVLMQKDNQWRENNGKFSDTLFMAHQQNYFNFILWHIMQTHGYYKELKQHYQQKIEELLQDLPLPLHDIPSIKNYIQNQGYLDTSTDEQYSNLDVLPKPYNHTQK